MRSFRSVANLIKAKRLAHAKGYSQAELSHVLGYKNGQFISNVERALCSIPLKMIKKICHTLDISHQEIREAIMRDTDEMITYYLGEQHREAAVLHPNRKNKSSSEDESSSHNGHTSSIQGNLALKNS